MKKSKLDKEEQELLSTFESNEFRSDMSSSRKELIKQVATQTFKKDKRIKQALMQTLGVYARKFLT